jgi:outer membrane protein TolC
VLIQLRLPAFTLVRGFSLSAIGIFHIDAKAILEMTDESLQERNIKLAEENGALKAALADKDSKIQAAANEIAGAAANILELMESIAALTHELELLRERLEMAEHYMNRDIRSQYLEACNARATKTADAEKV